MDMTCSRGTVSLAIEWDAIHEKNETVPHLDVVHIVLHDAALIDFSKGDCASRSGKWNELNSALFYLISCGSYDADGEGENQCEACSENETPPRQLNLIFHEDAKCKRKY